MLSHQFAVQRHRHHAGAAHAGRIDHDRVQARDGVHSVWPGELADRAHHQRRADGDHLGDLAAFAGLVLLQQLFQRCGDEAFDPECAVVGGIDDLQLLAELLLQLVDTFAFGRPEQ